MMDILTREFLQYVRVCLLKKDDENGQLDCGIYSSPAAAGFLCKVRSAIARYDWEQ